MLRNEIDANKMYNIIQNLDIYQAYMNIANFINDYDNDALTKNEKIEIEVFSPIGDVHKGDTLGKLSLYDENTEVTKTNFKACKDLSKECFEEIIS